MSQKDNQVLTREPEQLVSDEYYFRYIFKKTEKIACAVFYVIRAKKDIREDQVAKDTEDAASRALVDAVESLSTEISWSKNALRRILFRLIELESRLRVAQAASILTAEQLHVFVAEIDSVLRSIRSYLEKVGHVEEVFEFEPELKLQATRKAGGRSGVPRTIPGRVGQTEELDADAPRKEDRRARILDVLRAQPNASIKDIADTIKDCSEKTIQRELIVLIKDGSVVREGERRWSKYSVL